MSVELQLPKKYILSRAASASHLYKEYQIRKRQGGVRTIQHPAKKLKALQRFLLREVIELLPVHENSLAYRKGMNILDNARRHVNSRFLLRMDIEDFFPSLTETDIRTYIAQRGGAFADWGEEDVKLFCALVCKDSKLTIGAPTSPALSNALCFDMDMKLTQLASAWGVSYSRYADDLFFSASKPGTLRGLEKEVCKIVEGMDCPGNLRINRAKTRHASKRGTRRVTGLVLGSDGTVSVGRSLKRRIRSLVFRVDTLTPEQRRNLAGLLAYCESVERGFRNRLVRKYGVNRVGQAKDPRL